MRWPGLEFPDAEHLPDQRLGRPLFANPCEIHKGFLAIRLPALDYLSEKYVYKFNAVSKN